MTPAEQRAAWEARWPGATTCACTHTYTLHEIDRKRAFCSVYAVVNGVYAPCVCSGFNPQEGAA